MPVLYRGAFDKEKLETFASNMDLSRHEGFVVRPSDGFHYSEFKNVVVKFVRKGHVTTSNHWRHQKIIPNIVKCAGVD